MGGISANRARSAVVDPGGVVILLILRSGSSVVLNNRNWRLKKMREEKCGEVRYQRTV
jgi:hypothetical protein